MLASSCHSLTLQRHRTLNIKRKQSQWQQHHHGSRLGGHCRHRTCSVPVNALQIDRRHHMELQWQRQQERETQLAQLDLSQGSGGIVLQVLDLEHLEALLEKSGSNTVVLFMHSRTCGVCKPALQRYEAMCRDAAAARARVVFLKVDVHNEYDNISDVALWHKVKHVPTFLFFDEGAVVRRLTLRDVRQMAGSTAWIQGALRDDMRRLREVFHEVLFHRAPGTRN